MLVDVAALRVGHFLKSGALNQKMPLNDVTLRIGVGWTNEDEHALLRDTVYCDIGRIRPVPGLSLEHLRYGYLREA